MKSRLLFVTYQMLKKMNFKFVIIPTKRGYITNYYLRHTVRTGLHSSVQGGPGTPWQQAPPWSRPSFFTLSTWMKKVIFPNATFNTVEKIYYSTIFDMSYNYKRFFERKTQKKPCFLIHSELFNDTFPQLYVFLDKLINKE